MLVTMSGYENQESPKIYSNGLDLAWLLGSKDTSFVSKSFLALLLRLLTLEIPTVALVNGHAFAGGCLFALCHDYRVMRSDRGFLCMNEILLPSPLSLVMGSIIRCKLKDPKEWRDCALLAKRYGAAEGAKCGIVDLVVTISPDQSNQASTLMLQETLVFIRKLGLLQLSRKSKQIYGMLKASLYDPIIQVYEQREKDRVIDMKDFLAVGKL